MTKPLLKQKLLKLAVYLADEERAPIASQSWHPYVQKYTPAVVEAGLLAKPAIHATKALGSQFAAERAAGTLGKLGPWAIGAKGPVFTPLGWIGAPLTAGLEAAKGFNKFDQVGGWAAPTEMAGRVGLSIAPWLAAAGPVGWAGLAGKEVLERALINPTREAFAQEDEATAGARRGAVDIITQYAMMPPQRRIDLVRNNLGYRRALVNAHSELGGLGGVHTTMDPNLSALDLAKKYGIGKSNILRMYARNQNSLNIDPEMRKAIEAELASSPAVAAKSPTLGDRTQGAVDWLKKNKTGVGIGLGAAAIGIPALMLLYKGIQEKRRKRQEKTGAQGVGLPQGSNPWETRNPFTVKPSASKVPNDAKTMALPPTTVAGGPSNVMEAQMQAQMPNMPPTNMMPQSPSPQPPGAPQQGMTAMAASYLRKTALGSPSLEAAVYLKSISDEEPPSSQPKPEIRPKQVTQTDTTAVQSVKASPNI